MENNSNDQNSNQQNLSGGSLPPTSPSQLLLVPRIIWGVLLFSQFTYFLVVSTLPVPTNQVVPPPAFFDFSDRFTPPFITLALIELVAAYFIPKLMTPKSATAETDSLKLLLDRAFTGMIIRFALLESICLYGFVIALTSHDPRRMVPFALVATLGFALNFPTEEKIRAACAVTGPEKI